MEKEISTINKDTKASIEEKKSKFIAGIYKIKSKMDAEEKIIEIKKKYYDAKHNCFAFIVIDNGKKIIKVSDDGEPSGTAGLPILSVLEKNNLTNILVVVTRYFGGILLGTGGLVRAYTNATQEVLKNTTIIQEEDGRKIQVEIDYSNNSDFKYYCEKNDIKVDNIEYNESILYTLEISEEQMKNLKSDIESNNNVLPFKIKKYVTICRKYVEKGK